MTLAIIIISLIFMLFLCYILKSKITQKVKHSDHDIIPALEDNIGNNDKNNIQNDSFSDRMENLYKEGIIAHIQIHDELDISVKNDKEAKHIVEIMESAVELAIPNKVDYEAGDNWGEIH